jgi:tetraacyldisaccharide 4'-kinase
LNVPDSLRGKRVFAFSGLADNEQFFDSLRAEGLTLERTRGFPDHHAYSALDLAQIHHAARGTDAIVTTEKDAVKIHADDIVAIPAEFIFDDDVLQRIETVARS